MVEMRCTKWEAGLTSNDTSVSLFHCDTSSFHCGASKLLPFPTAGDNFAKLILDMRCVILEAGCLLATPTSSWQHHIEPQSAFPQQLLQITKIFSLRPPTFLSTKTNELTLIGPPHWTTVCLSSAISSSFKNTQLTASYLSFYKDQ